MIIVGRHQTKKPRPFGRGLFLAKIAQELTLVKAFCPQRFKTTAIVHCKTTHEYFQYLYEPWDCFQNFANIRAQPNSTSQYRGQLNVGES